jgi:F0F1-type ATP synthase membrane subunit b/b'
MRADLVAETRREVDRSLGDAEARLRAQAEVARAQLDRDANLLAGTIVERVLGRSAS